MLLSFVYRLVWDLQPSMISEEFRMTAVQCVCLGNHGGLGSVRGKELFAACSILGVSIIEYLRLHLPAEIGPALWHL